MNTGEFPFTLSDSSGSEFLSGNPTPDTEFSSGGYGFMHSKSNPNSKDLKSLWDNYIITSRDGSDSGGGGTTTTTTTTEGPTDTTTEEPTETETETQTDAPDEQSPYGGSPVSLPGRVQAENFDTGGEGVAYHDTSSGNNGSATYRDTNVDIQPTSDDGGGYNIGWIEDGEWLEYTIDADAADYDISARLAGKNGDARLRVSLNGTQVTTFGVPDTGGWQTWTTNTRGTFSLDGGTRTLRLEMVGGSFNVNWVEFNTDTGGDSDGGSSGQRVEVTTDSSDDVLYLIESNGDLAATDTDSLEGEDGTSGSKAKGIVRAGDADAYTLTNGDLTDVSTFGGDVIVTVDATAWSD
jgi:hypothetical protein